VEVRGRAEAVEEPEAIIRIYPERIISWGLDSERSARTVIRQGQWQWRGPTKRT
jgi:pyridoxamine 5'-phosphate oxidase family protein